jgi:hypothetical protein
MNLIIVCSPTGATLYVDGVDNDGFKTWSSAITSVYIKNIGTAGDGASFPFAGQISNVVTWTSDQTTEVNNIYNNGTPATSYTNPPTGWYKLDNTTTGIQDSGSASNNGTNNGATEIQTNVWTPRLNGESTTLPSTALVSSDLQFESPYSLLIVILV